MRQEITLADKALRDHFAGQALTGLIAAGVQFKVTEGSQPSDYVACAAYVYADSMMHWRSLELPETK